MTGLEKPRILCVSRSSSQLEAICSALPRREYEVVTATTPEQAVAVCVSNNLAAVVLDSELSTDAGWSAARTFKMVNRTFRWCYWDTTINRRRLTAWTPLPLTVPRYSTN
jgi:CheY-like chemotaxis protein